MNNVSKCKTCGGYPIRQTLYSGPWKFHPSNPANPSGYTPTILKCPECFPEEEVKRILKIPDNKNEKG